VTALLTAIGAKSLLGDRNDAAFLRSVLQRGHYDVVVDMVLWDTHRSIGC